MLFISSSCGHHYHWPHKARQVSARNSEEELNPEQVEKSADTIGPKKRRATTWKISATLVDFSYVLCSSLTSSCE
jgi:hypothetical protein